MELLPAFVGAPEADRVYHCDALTLLRAMPDASVDAVVTDPPYGTDVTSWDTSIDARIFAECIRVSRGYSFFCYSNTRLWHILGIMHDLGVDTWVMVWHKSNSMGFERKFAPQWTPIVCAYKSSCDFWGKDLFHCPLVPQNVGHPTPKPVRLFEWLIEKSTPVNGVILDPFLGSGTAALAARNMGRHFIACDANTEYVQVARARLSHGFTPNMFATLAG